MGLINTLLGVLPDSHQMAPVPIVERLRAQVAEQEALLPDLRAAVEEANFQAAVLPGAETDAALSLAQVALDTATRRHAALQAALTTASQKAADAAADEATRLHEAKLRKLEAHTVTLRRKIKAHAVELERVVRSHAEMLAAVEQVTNAYPGRVPQGHGLTYSELSTWVRQELARCTALRDPAGWAKVGNKNFFLSVNPAQAGAFHKSGSGHLVTMEQHGAQAMESLMRIARGIPVPAPAAPPAPTRLKAVVFEPADPATVSPDKPPPFDTTLEGLKAEYARLHPNPLPNEEHYSDETEFLASASELTAPDELNTLDRLLTDGAPDVE